MKNTIILIFILSSVFSCNFKNEKVQTSSYKEYTFSFEGTEPFWRLDINNNNINLFINNEYSSRVEFSKLASRGETLGFKNQNIYGFINKNWEGNCDFSISEIDLLNYEIFFVYNGKAYKGCGYKVD